MVQGSFGSGDDTIIMQSVAATGHVGEMPRQVFEVQNLWEVFATDLSFDASL